MRKLLLCVMMLALPVASLAASQAEQKTVGGEPVIVLENDLVKVTVAPLRGGQVCDYLYKPDGKHLTAEETGLLVDRVWNYADNDIYQQWGKSPYNFKILSSGAEAAVELSCRGTAGVSQRIIIHKTYTLPDGSSALRADYRTEVGQEAMAPMTIGMWWHGRPGVRGENNTFYLPTDGKVQEITYGAGAKGQYWWYKPVRGWLAARGESGSGLAIVIDYKRLMSFYQWLYDAMPGLEFAYRSFEIENGKSLDTTLWLVPFRGLPNVTGAAAEVVAALEVPAQSAAGVAEVPYKVTLSVPQALEGTLKLSLKQPDGTVQPLQEKALTFKGETSVAGALKPAGPGLYVVQGVVLVGGKPVLDFEKPAQVGEGGAAYALAPVETRLGREGEKFEDKLATAGNAPPDLKMTDEIVTPHVPWGRPYYRGKTKALVLTSFQCGRETVELAQRLDLDYVAPTVGSAYELGYTTGLFGKEINLEQSRGYVREALKQPYDVILIGGYSGEFFTPDLLAAILEKVRGGTGLVWVQPNKLPAETSALLPLADWKATGMPQQSYSQTGEHYLTVGVPLGVLPQSGCSLYKANGEVLAKAGDRPLLAVREEGKGRIVCLGYNTSWQGAGSYANGMTPWVRSAPQKFDYWEYQLSLLAKSVLWASRREPEIALAGVDGGAGKADIRLINPGPARPVEAWVRVCDEYGHVEQEQTQKAQLASGAANIEVKLPRLPGGLHLVDVIVKSDGKVLTWGSAAIKEAPTAAVETAAPDKEAYAAGEALATKISVSGLAGEGKPGTLVVSLTDDLGREIARQSQAVAVGDKLAVDCRLVLPEPLTTRGMLRAELRDAQGVVAAQERDVMLLPKRVADRDWGTMTWTMWGSPAGAYSNDWLQRGASDRCRAMGMDTVQVSARWLQPGENESNYLAGFRLMPYGIGGGPLRLPERAGKDGKPGFHDLQEQYVKTGDKKFLERPVSLEDPAARQAQAEEIASVLKTVAKFKPVGYCLGDELGTTYYTTPFDFDFSPVSLQGFRKWLQGQYASLEALNAEWETSFRTWDEVMPMTALEIRERKNYAPWADHRTYMEYVFADYMKFVRDTVRHNDPDGKIGISGTQAAEAYGGFDWWRLSKTLDFIQSYDHQNTGDMHRSFGMVTLPWWGYAQTAPAVTRTMWNRFLNRARGGSFFVYNYMLNPDLTFPQATADGVAAIRDQQNGLGLLLQNCPERPADVLLHYSQPSIHAAYATNGDALMRNDRDGWLKAIDDLGMQADFVAYAQIEEGALNAKPRALVLPYSQALSAKEVEAIKAYVRGGGFLIADGRPALMDEHCKPLLASALDEVFGVTGQADPLAKMPPGELEFTSDLGACKVSGLIIDGAPAQTNLKPAGGTALGKAGETPLLVINSYGKGKAALLNMFVDQYPRRRELGAQADMLELVQQALAAGGVTPKVAMEVSKGQGAVLRRFTCGEAQYLGVLRDLKPGGATIKLTLPQKRHVYDCRAGKYLGETDQIACTPTAGDAAIYALLPAAVTAVKVQPQSATCKAGATVSFNVSATAGAPAVMRVFRVQVMGPDGKERSHYGSQLAAKAGTAQGSLALALTDAPGKWEIVATDVATGVSGRATVQVAK
ncbi:MAG: DUF7408 domain-containing protein [Armatimonadota bacterium]